VRINIETSEGLAQSQWIDLMRADLRRFRKMVKTANGRGFLMEDFERCFGLEWLEREKARVLVNPTRALANGILNEHWRNGSGIEDAHAGSIAPPRPLTQCRLTKAQEMLLMQETAEQFVPTMRAFYHVVSKPCEDTWPEQALPYAIAFKPPADWSLDEQTREIALPDAEPE